MSDVRILIVEDAGVIALDIQRTLAQLGYLVAGVAASKDEAIRLARQTRPDVVLMDIKLGNDMAGIDAATAIRQELDIPIIYLTAYGDEETLRRARLSEPYGYLLKPFEPRELAVAIEMALYKHALDQKLRQSEERYRTLFENVPAGLYRTTPDGQILDANPALRAILGYPAGDLNELSVWDSYVNKADRQRWMEIMERKGMVQNFEVQLRRADGSVVWALETARAVCDASGRTLYYEGSLEDITERKQVEAAWHEAAQAAIHGQHMLLALGQAAQAVQRAHTPAQVYQTIGEQIARLGHEAVILTLSDDGLYLRLAHHTFEAAALQVAEQLADQSAQDWRFALRPGSIHSRILTEKQAAFFEDAAELFANAIADIPHPTARQMAQTLCFERAIYCPLLLDERPVGLLGVIGKALTEEDVSAISAFAHQAAIALENARLYQTMQAERDRTQRYLDIAGVILVALDRQGVITLINQKGCALLGWSEDQLVGKSWFDTCLPARIREKTRAVFAQLMAGQIKESEYYENPILTRDGQERLIAWHNTILRDEAGHITGALSSGEDITERKRAQAALAERERLYRSLFEGSRDGIVFIDTEGNFVDCNQSYLNMLGYSWNELGTMNFLQITPEKWHRWEMEEIVQKQLLTRGYTDTYQKEYIRKDGSIFPVELTAYKLEGQGGKPTLLWGVARDITQRVRAEQALRESEERYRQLFENASDAILILQGERCLECNSRTAEMFGVPRDQIIGKSPFDFSPPIQPDGCPSSQAGLEKITAALEGNPQRFEWRHSRPDGTTFETEVTLNKLEIGGELFLQAIVRDVTERKQAEEHIRRRARELEGLNQVIQLLNASLDVEHALNVATEQITRLLDVEASSLLLYAPDQNDLYFAAAAGGGVAHILGQRLAMGQGIIGWVAQTGEPAIVPDVTRDPRWYSGFDAQTSFTTRSMVCAPMHYHNQLIGVLSALNKRSGAPDQQDLWWLSSLGAAAATAIANARLYQAEREQRELAETLREIGAALAETLDADVVLNRMLDHIGRVVPHDVVNVMLLEGERARVVGWRGYERFGTETLIESFAPAMQDTPIRRKMLETRRPIVISDIDADPQWNNRPPAMQWLRSYVTAPICVRDRVIGFLNAGSATPNFFGPQDAERLFAFAHQAAIAFENARLYEQTQQHADHLRQLSRGLVEVQEAERRNIARELHDETGQALSSLLLGLSLLQKDAGQAQAVIKRAVELENLADEMLENLHRLTMNLRPATLDYLGLAPALEQYLHSISQQHGLTIAFEAPAIKSERLPPTVEIALYRIVQEAMTNIVRHAQASRVDVLIERRADGLVTVIEDDGVGFDIQAAMRSNRLGLLGMRERAETLGGRLLIESAPGAGTTVVVEVPYDDSPGNRR